MELDPMENSWLDESMAIGQSSAFLADQTSSEGFSLDQSELMTNVVIEDAVGQSETSTRSLRSSKRRVLKNSSVVLNADRLKRVIDKLPSDGHDSTTEGDGGDMDVGLQDLTDLTIHENSHDRSTDSHLQSVHQKLVQTERPKIKRVMTSDRAAWIICRYWRRRRTERLFRFTIGRKLSLTCAVKLFTLLLGYRVRRLFRQIDVKKAVAAQRDMERVLLDLLNQQTDNIHDGKQQVFWLPTIKSIISNRRFFAAADATLAKSLLKELLAQKEKLIKFVFFDCNWIAFPLLYPATGYWNISSSRSMNRKTSQIFSPPRSTTDKVPLNEQQAQLTQYGSGGNRRAKVVPETPPHVKYAVERSHHEKAKKVPVRLNLGRNPNPIIDSIPEDATLDTSSPQALVAESSFIQSGSDVDSDRNRPMSLRDILAAKAAGNNVPSSSNSTLATPSEYYDDRPITPSAAYGSGGGNAGVPSLDIVKSKLKAKTTKSNGSSAAAQVEGVTVAGSLQAKLASHAKIKKDPPSASAHISSSISTGSSSSSRHRSGDGGHIQLDILSGERLIPAKKGAVSNKETGVGPIPDRKPGLKITLHLPPSGVNPPAGPVNSRASPMNNASTPSSSALKKAFHTVKDFDELTLNPHWDSTFEIPLPIPKTILKNIAEQEDINFQLSTDTVTLTEDQYNSLCKILLNYWSGGNILIEVCDGERFNEEIFMGQVLILITSFMPLIKKHHELEIKGSFSLEKQKPTNRVSGNIRLHAYLHVPLKSYLEDLLKPFVQTVVAASRVSNGRLGAQSGKHNSVAKEQAASDRRRSTSRSHLRPANSSISLTGNPLYSASTGNPVSAAALLSGEGESDNMEEDNYYGKYYGSDYNYDSGFDSGYQQQGSRTGSRSASRNRGRPVSTSGPTASSVLVGHSQKTSPSSDLTSFQGYVATDLSLSESCASDGTSVMEKPKYFSKFMQSLATSLEEIDSMLHGSKVDSRRLRQALLQQQTQDETVEGAEERALKQKSQLPQQKVPIPQKPSKSTNQDPVVPVGHADLLALATLHEPNLEESENIKLPLSLPINLPSGVKKRVPPPPPPQTPPPPPTPPSNKVATSPSPSPPDSSNQKTPVHRGFSPAEPSSSTPPPPPPSSLPGSSAVTPTPSVLANFDSEVTPGVSPRASRLPRYSSSKGPSQTSPNGDEHTDQTSPIPLSFPDGRPGTTPGQGSKNATPVPGSGQSGNGSGNKNPLQKRMFINDMYKQLDSITAMQQSTDEAVDNWSKRLEAKRKEKSLEGSRIPIPISVAAGQHERVRSPDVERLTPSLTKTPANGTVNNVVTHSSPEVPTSSSSQRLAAQFEDQDSTILVESEEEATDYHHYHNRERYMEDDNDRVNEEDMEDEEDYEHSGLDTEDVEELDDILDEEDNIDDDLLDTDGIESAEYLTDGDIPFERKGGQLYGDGSDSNADHGEEEVMIIPSPLQKNKTNNTSHSHIVHQSNASPSSSAYQFQSSPKYSPNNRRNILSKFMDQHDEGEDSSSRDGYHGRKGGKSSPPGRANHVGSPNNTRNSYTARTTQFRHSGDKYSLPPQRQSRIGVDGISSDEEEGDVYENDFDQPDGDDAYAPISVISMRQKMIPLPAASSVNTVKAIPPSVVLPSGSSAYRSKQQPMSSAYGSDGLYSDSNNDSDSYVPVQHTSVAHSKRIPLPVQSTVAVPSSAQERVNSSSSTPSRIPRNTALSSSPRTRQQLSATDSGEDVRMTPTGGRRFFPSSPSGASGAVPRAAPLHLIDSDEDDEHESSASYPNSSYRSSPGRQPSQVDVANARRAATSASAKIAVKRAIIELGDLDML